ncbi:ribonuclease D [Agaribacterium sp. ZY112]|uniref:ribonuclease D n=1 Tax=Agaribacterium sp. ZY112 TaxID=3233574 RepID=UPI00352611DA
MVEDLLKQEIHWIDSDQALEQVCERWQEKRLLVLDTEFIRTNTYYPIAGLIQLSDGDASYLIDPKTIQDWYPLIELLDDEHRIIAMHACGEDLEVLQQEVGCIPACIFDTQVAVAFTGGAASMGYGALVEQELDCVLPKGETRSDWLQRPLSKPQIMYAALDVEYLYKLAEVLMAKLEEQNKLEWVMEEGRRSYRQFKALQVGKRAVERIKSAWKLNARQLTLLTYLADWRENLAQQLDMPRNRLLKESALFDIAIKAPEHISQLRGIEGVSERIINKNGRHIMSIVEQVSELDETALVDVLPKPFDKAQREKLQNFRAVINELALELGVATEHLFRKKGCEHMLRLALAEQWQEIESMFDGWREQALKATLIEHLKKL